MQPHTSVSHGQDHFVWFQVDAAVVASRAEKSQGGAGQK